MVRLLTPLALVVLAAVLPGCAGTPATVAPRTSVSTAVWRVDAPRDRIAAAFDAVRDSLGIAPLEASDSVAIPASDLVVGGRIRSARVTVGLTAEGAATRLHLQMQATPSAAMEHLAWATRAVARLGSAVTVVNVPEAIWPSTRATCVGLSPVVGSPAQGWMAPSLVSGREPVYTREARREGVRGRVIVRLAVDARGDVACAEVASGLPHGLSQSAIAAARSWKFRPATRYGGRSAATLVTSIVFPAAGPSMALTPTGAPVCPREDPHCRI